MTSHSTPDLEIRDLIRKHGRITFAQFMQICLYSSDGGFYASRRQRIGTHFGTSPTSHPAFGALIACQLEQMWHHLGDPPVFHVVEVGAGDGALAQSIVHACRLLGPGLRRALRYVAVDYEPRWPHSSDHRVDWTDSAGGWTPVRKPDSDMEILQVKGAGLRAFRNVVGCILSNELLDNFPVHRFAIHDGRVKEVFVTMVDGNFTEVLGDPSSPRIQERLASLNLSLTDGYRGEVNLAMEDWADQVSRTLHRGYVLTIDYGQHAAGLYAPGNSDGTLVCFHRHDLRLNPYRNIGQQDITSHVDFTTLMRLGEQHGLATVGYIPQREFLMNLGFQSLVDALDTKGLSAARMALSRMAMMALVDPEQYGDLKVLAQAKGIGLALELLGFTRKV